MKPHVKNYLTYFNIGEQDIWHCEVCGTQRRIDNGLDLHHIVFRSHGGHDKASNIICLCRKCHDAAHGLTKTFLHPDMLQVIHNEKMMLK